MYKFSLALIFSLCVNILATPLIAQTDSIFWFGAPDLQQSHGDRPIYLRMSSMGLPATVSISQPANPTFIPIQVNLPANTSQSVDLTPFIDQIENTSINTITNKGLLIRSTSLISCYYDIASVLNGDIYALKGFNGLGLKFTIPFQQAFSSWGIGSGYFADFIIIATENNTLVTINPKKNLVGHPANVPFTITLNKGDTYLCRAESDSPQERPGGTTVSANKQICISTKDDSINYPGYGCADTAGDQLIPDNNSGQDFIVVKGYFYGPDNYYVFAIQDATEIRVNGLLVATINSGDYYVGTLSDPSCFVEANKNVHLYHISGFGCEIGGAVVPSLKCTGSTSVSITRATDQDFFVNIIAPNTIINNFSFNGASNIITGSTFSTVPGTGGQWMYSRIAIPTTIFSAGSNARIENSTGKFHIGIIHGDQGSTTRYGFFSDFSKTRFMINNDSVYCRGSNVSIIASYNGGSNYTWTDPQGNSTPGAVLNLPNFQSSNAGLYTISAEAGGCGIANQSIYIEDQRITPSFNVNTPTCINAGPFRIESTTTINSGSITNFEWDLGDGSRSSGNPIFHQYNSPGNFSIKLKETTNIGCKDSTEKTIKILPTNTSNNFATICQGSSYWNYNTNGTYRDTFVSVNGCDSIRILHLTVLPKLFSTINHSMCSGEYFLGYYQSGIYTDTLLGSNGCDSIRTLNLVVKNKIVSNISKTICEGNNYQGHTITGVYIDTFASSNGCDSIRTLNLVVKKRTYSTLSKNICEGQNFYGYTTSGQFIDTLIGSNGCDSIRTIILNIYPNPSIGISIQPEEGCVPLNVNFINQTFYNQQLFYSWDFGDNTQSTLSSPNHIYTNPGVYSITIRGMSALGCADTIKLDSIIKVFPLPVVNFSLSPEFPELGNSNIQFTDLSAGATKWHWNFGENNAFSEIKNPQHIYENAGSFLIELSVFDKNNCFDSASKFITIKPLDNIYIPNAFSPNGDGHNDLFRIFGIGIKKITLTIYDRWGEIVYSTNNNLPNWNGKKNGVGKNCDGGNYVYVVNLTDKNGRNRIFKGNLLLIR